MQLISLAQAGQVLRSDILQSDGSTFEGQRKKDKLNRRIRNVWELQGRSDLVKVTNMSMRVLFIMSVELLVLKKCKETMLELKVISSNCWNNNCILVTLGGCLEQLSHSTLIGHHEVGFED
nr:hypothetical protein [Tanacetum cinerariifolium]